MSKSLEEEAMSELREWEAWAQEKAGRSVDIKLRHGQEPQIWVYDSNLMDGQFVSSVGEIQLEQIHATNERKKYEALRQKFEGRAA